MPRPAFTLLESLVALTILALVAGACLELRAGALAHTRTLAGRQEDQRLAKAVFDLALAGHLGAPSRASQDADAPSVWTGERDGVEYRLMREPIVVPNPLFVAEDEGEASPFPDRATLFRYTLELGDDVYVMEWTG